MAPANWTAKTTLCIIAVSVIIAVALRYPLVEHERFQTDSYFIHSLSQSIVDNGYATWIFHPLSYFGYYPVSYPSGYPVVLSEVAILTGLSVEASMLVSTVFLGALFSLAIFCLGREILVRTDLSLLAMMLATFAPRFVDTTYWNGSARGPEAVMFAILLIVVYRASATHSHRMLALAPIIVITCLALHHMAVLIALAALAVILTHIAVGRLSHISRPENRMPAVASVMLILLVAGVLSVIFSPSLTRSIQVGFSSGFVSTELEVLAIVLNMGVSYAHQIGIALLFIPFGFYIVFVRGLGSARLYLPLITFLVFIPVLDKSLYVSLLLLPFACIIGSLAFGPVVFRTRPRARAISVCILLVTCSLLCVLSIDRWNGQTYQTGDDVTVENQVFSDARYLDMSFRDVPSIVNQNVLFAQLGATTSLDLVGSDMYLVLSGQLSADELRGNLTTADSQFPSSLYLWFRYDDRLQVSRLVHRLFTLGVGYVEASNVYEQSYLSENPSMLVIVDADWPSEYATLHGSYDAELPNELKDAILADGTSVESYLVYSTAGLSAYMWELPVII